MTRLTIQRLVAALIAVLVVSFGFVAPANAAAPTGVTWNIDRGLAGDTGVRYTWTFTAAATGNISSVSMSIPSGTNCSSIVLGDVFGLSKGTIGCSGTVVTYNVTTPTTTTAGTSILISATGFTNTATAGSYQSSVSTNIDTTPALSEPATSIAPNTDTVTIDVLPSLSFSTNKTNVNFAFNGGLTATDSTQFHIKSNAGAGYRLFASATDLATSGGSVIPMVATSVGAAKLLSEFPTSGAWGFTVPSVVNGGGGTLLPTGSMGTKYATPCSWCHGGSEIANQTSTTNDDTINLSYYAQIPATQSAGIYTSKITFTAIPSY